MRSGRENASHIQFTCGIGHEASESLDRILQPRLVLLAAAGIDEDLWGGYEAVLLQLAPHIHVDLQVLRSSRDDAIEGIRSEQRHGARMPLPHTSLLRCAFPNSIVMPRIFLI